MFRRYLCALSEVSTQDFHRTLNTQQFGDWIDGDDTTISVLVVVVVVVVVAVVDDWE